MAPNLSFEHLALVLALAGCSKATPAADSTSTTVRSDPATTATASATADRQQGLVAPMQASAAATIGAPGSPAPRGGASANELREQKGDMGNPTGQASCGAGSCTSEIKKK
jgi:hypothetical protein